MPDWLLVSIAGSIILTLLLNILPRLFPGLARHVQEIMIGMLKDDGTVRDHEANSSRYRIYFPWKAMLIVSVVLTVLINLVTLAAQRG